jgi:hypothetical protein
MKPTYVNVADSGTLALRILRVDKEKIKTPAMLSAANKAGRMVSGPLYTFISTCLTLL